MMSRFWWACAVLLLTSTSLFSQQPAALTRYEAKLDLLGNVPVSEPLSLLQEEILPAKKSVGLAVLYSLLLPGMGELYAEGFSSGKYFLIAEGALWLGYAAVQVHGDELRDDARAFAVSHAGVDVTGKNDDFFVDRQLHDRG